MTKLTETIIQEKHSEIVTKVHTILEKDYKHETEHYLQGSSDIVELIETFLTDALEEQEKATAEEIRNELIVIQNAEIAHTPLKQNRAAQKINDLLGKIYSKYLRT